MKIILVFLPSLLYNFCIGLISHQISNTRVQKRFSIWSVPRWPKSCTFTFLYISVMLPTKRVWDFVKNISQKFVSNNQLFEERILTQWSVNSATDYWFTLLPTVKANSGDKMTFGQQSSADTFLVPEYRPLYSFILRPEAGHGDTIDKYSSFCWDFM